MNKVHRTLWNNALNAWVAVAENAKSSGKTKTTKTVLASPLLAALSISGALAAPPNPPATNALPTGGVVSAGQANLSQAGTSANPVLNINQSTQRAAINWSTFNVGQAATVNFNQPSAQSVTLNRVADSNPSQIFGKINATGQVYLVNPRGVYFSRTASVDVVGLVATTHSMSDNEFMAGSNTFKRNGATGRVENEGELKAKLDGYIALLAPEVVNKGVIVAERGTAVLANGESITLDFNADHKLSGIVVTASDIASLIENKQAIETPDGQIIMSAQSVSNLRGSLIKNSGTLIANTGANSITHKGGRILLEGDEVTLTGTSKIEAKGEQGGGTVLVGGDWQGSNGVYQATKTTMEAGATIDASATQNGDGGKVVLWSDVHNTNGVTQMSGSITALGKAGGAGGHVETSGNRLGTNGVISLGDRGLWLLDPTNVNIASTSTTGTMSGDLSSASAVEVKATDIATALNGGANVSVTASGSITLNANLTVNIPAGLSSTLTFDNTSGTNQSISIRYPISQTNYNLDNANAGIFNFIAKSSGGVISTLASATISIKGSLTLDNTNAGAVTTTNIINNGVGVVGAINVYSGNVTLRGITANSSGGSVGGVGYDYCDIKAYDGIISINGSSIFSGTPENFAYGIYAQSGTLTALKIILQGYKSQKFGANMKVNSLTINDKKSDGVTANPYAVDGSNVIEVTGGWLVKPTTFHVNEDGVQLGTIKILPNKGDISIVSDNLVKLGEGGNFMLPDNSSSNLTVNTASGDLNRSIFIGNSTAGVNTIKDLSGNVSTTGFKNLYAYTNGAKITIATTLPVQNEIILDNTCSICSTVLSASNGSSANVSNGGVIFRSINTGSSGSLTVNSIVSGSGTAAISNQSGTALTLNVGSLNLKSQTTESGNPASGSGNINLGQFNITLTGSVDSSIAAGYNRPAGDYYGGAVLKPLSVTNNGTGELRVFTGAPTVTPATDYGTSSTAFSTWGTMSVLNNLVYASKFDTQAEFPSGHVSKTPVVYNRYAPTATFALNSVSSDSVLYGTSDTSILTAVRASLLSNAVISNVSSYLGMSSASTSDLNAYKKALINSITLPTVTLSGAGFRPVNATPYVYQWASGAITGITLAGSGVNDGTGGTISGTLKSTLSITPRDLTVGGLSVTDKPYDGTTLAAVAGTPTYSGKLAGDAFTFSATSGTFASANVGTHTVTLTPTMGGADAANYNIVAPSSLQGTITAKALTITGQTAANKPYDSTNAASLSGGTLVGIVGSENVTLATESGTFASVNVGTGISITGTSTLGGTAAGNYTLTQPTGLSASITAKALTVIGQTAANKTYDSTNTATLSGGTLVGVVGSEDVSLTQAGTFASVNVATGISITAANALAGTAIANYSLTQPTGLTANITAKALTITGQTAANKTYDGNNTATLSGGTLVGVVGSENVTLASQTGTFASVNVGTGIGVTGGSTLGGTAAGNYTLTQPPGLTADITAKSLTISGLTASNKPYDGTTAATVSNWGSVSTGVGSETLTLNSGTATFATPGAANGKTVTATGYTLADGSNGGLASNYVLSSTSSTTTANITPKVLTVSGLTASNKTYDGTTAATVSGATVTTGVTGESLTLNGGTATFADANAGVGKTVTATGYSLADGTGGVASNYTLSSTSSTATATIDPKTLTVSGFAVSGKTYDGTNAVTVSSWGSVATGISGEALTLNHGTASLSDFNAGTGKTATATGYTLANGTGGLASNYVLSSTSSTATMDIAQKQVTVSGLAMNNRTYNGTTDVTASVSSWGSVATGVAGESLVVTPGTASLADANAGTGKTVTAIGYALGNGTGGLASNYLLTNTSSTATMDIARKAVTVQGQTVGNKTYDGTNAAPVANGTLDGVISGDNLLLNQSATFASANVGTGLAVTATNTLGGTSVGNYVITTQPTLPSADITTASLTLTASAASKVYGSAKTFAGTEFTSSGLQNGETVGSVSLASTGAASTVGVGSYPITISAATGGTFTASNYSISYTNGALTVTPKALTVNGLTVSGKTYDGTTTAQINTSGVSLAGLVGSDDVTVTVTGANFVSANAGTHTVSLTSTNGGADVGNYTITAPNSLTGTISPAPLTVAAQAKTMTYGASTLPSLTYTTAGLVSGDSLNGALATTATTYNGTAGSASNVGTYPISQGTLSAGSNYTLTSFTGANLTVQPATLTYVAGAATSVYGQTPNVSAGSLSGLVNGDTQAGVTTGSMSFATTATATSGVGSYAVTGSGLTANSNYTLIQAAGNATALTITPATLTVTAAAKTMTYGGNTLPALTYTSSGLVNGDAISGTLSTTAVAYNGTAGSGSNAGSYPIEQGTLTAGNNYMVSYTGANLTVQPATLTYAAGSATSVYGQTPSVNAGTLTGLVNGDTQAGATTGSLSFTTTATSTSGVGSYAVTGGGLTANSNYTLVQAGGNSTALTITPAALTVTADAKSMTYGDSTLPSLTYTSSGLVNGDALSGVLSTTATAYNGTAGSGSNAGSYPIAQGTLSASNNYALNYTSANLTVVPAVLTLTAGPATSVYGQTPSLNAGNLTGLVNGDTQAGATTGSLSFTTTATSTSGVGSYAITGGGLTANSNYTLVQAGGNTTALTITPAALTVTADAKSMTYGDSTLPSLTYTANGLVNGDALSGVLSTTATAYNGTAGSAADAGNYPIAQGTLSAGNNYTVSYLGSNLTVNPATLTVQANDQIKTYDGQGHTAGVTYAGFVAGQSASVLSGVLNLGGVSNYDAVTVYNGESRSGSYDVTPAGLTSGNYSINYMTGLLAIDPAPLTVTARGQIKVQDNAPYTGGNGVDFVGFVNGESASALNGTLTYSGTSQNATRPGTYTIAPGGVTSTDYAITFANGSLLIKPRPVTSNLAATITASAAVKAVSSATAPTVPASTTATTAVPGAANAVAASTGSAATNATTGTATASTSASTSTTATSVVPIPSTPLVGTLTNTKSALELGAFKVVGSTGPGLLDVVYVPNPAFPQSVIQVVQLPLTTGQGAVPVNVMNDLYLSGGVVTASAPAVSAIGTGTGAGAGTGTGTGTGTAAVSGAAAPATAAPSGAAQTASASPTPSATTGAGGTGATATATSTTASTTTSASTTTAAASTTAATGSATDTASTSTADDDKKNNVRVEQSQITTVLANDAPLPTQLTFNPEDKSFTLAKGAEVKLPLQVKIQLRQGGSVVSEKLVMLTNEF